MHLALFYGNPQFMITRPGDQDQYKLHINNNNQFICLQMERIFLILYARVVAISFHKAAMKMVISWLIDFISACNWFCCPCIFVGVFHGWISILGTKDEARRYLATITIYTPELKVNDCIWSKYKYWPSSTCILNCYFINQRLN